MPKNKKDPLFLLLFSVCFTKITLTDGLNEYNETNSQWFHVNHFASLFLPLSLSFFLSMSLNDCWIFLSVSLVLLFLFINAVSCTLTIYKLQWLNAMLSLFRCICFQLPVITKSRYCCRINDSNNKDDRENVKERCEKAHFAWNENREWCAHGMWGFWMENRMECQNSDIPVFVILTNILLRCYISN